MRAHYLQHVPFEGLGSIEKWLARAQYQSTCTRLYAGEALPPLTDIDLLIIMGGPMSVNDTPIYAWLNEEKRFIQTAIKAGVPVLGICLGAQLIAQVMGGRVFPNPVKEIGWYPVTGLRNNDEGLFAFSQEPVEVFHWHGETFSLPQGAICLAESEGCSHQAFQLGSKVIGLQFHLETTPESARALLEHCGEELVEGRFIQSAADILAASAQQYAVINQQMQAVLQYLARQR